MTLQLDAPTLTYKLPREDQADAVDALAAALGSADRTQMIAACGSGKTLTQQWVADRIAAAGIVVVAVPSIGLVGQTIRSWRVNAQPGTEFSFMAVCSDDLVMETKEETAARRAGGRRSKVAPMAEAVEDQIDPKQAMADMASAYGAGRVTTEVEDVVDCIGSLPHGGRLVLFSTHASLWRVEAALQDTGREAQLLIIDEAHRATGAESQRKVRKSGTPSFGSVATDTFPAGKRLFATATPRITQPSAIEDADEDITVFSMQDDPNGAFGAVAYRLTFAEAIALGLLVDYDIVVQITKSDETAKMVAARKKIVEIEGEKVDAVEFAAHLAVIRAAKEHGSTRMVTFHHSVLKAERFAKLHGPISALMDPGRPVHVEDISAKHSAPVREEKLERLATLDGGRAVRAVIANCHVLTEGIDVPSIDAVAFVDPKGSVVDIAQAVGRAMRIWDGKDRGVVLVPLVVPPGVDDVDRYMADGAWRKVSLVLDAIKATDNRLGELLTSEAIKVDFGPDLPVDPPLPGDPAGPVGPVGQSGQQGGTTCGGPRGPGDPDDGGRDDERSVVGGDGQGSGKGSPPSGPRLILVGAHEFAETIRSHVVRAATSRAVIRAARHERELARHKEILRRFIDAAGIAEGRKRMPFPNVPEEAEAFKSFQFFRRLSEASEAA